MKVLGIVVLSLLVIAPGGTVPETEPETVLTPPGNRPVPVGYQENVTTFCSIQEENSSLQALWRIDGTQISSSTQLQNRGLWIDPPPSIDPGTSSSTSTITFLVTHLQANNNTRVECQAYNSSFARTYPTGENSSFLFMTYVAPSAVRNLDLQPTLRLEWNRPSVPTFADIPTDYEVQINATEEDGMNFRNSTSNTFLSVQYLEDMLRDSDRACVEFEFIVSARNGAGTGPLARIKDTVPISPDVRNVSRHLTVVSVDVQSQTAQILFPPVMPCSVNFSLTNYTINIDGDMNRTLTPGEVTLGEPLTIRNLVLDASLSLTITACNSVTCRTSDQRTLNTTDVQTVQAVFFGNHLFLNCSFADGSQARGCVFEFTVVSTNRTDQHNVSRQGLRGYNCTEAPYRLDAYGNMFVMDWEENRMVGSVPLNITNTTMVTNITNAEEYFNLTGCSVDEAPPTVQTNVAAIAGSTVTLGVVIIVVVVVLSIPLIVFIKKRNRGSSLSRKRSRIASDSGDTEDIPVFYECEINAGDFKDRMIKSLERDEGEASKKATTASGPPPPPTFRYLNDKETNEKEPMEATSSETPGDVSSSVVIEMEREEVKESTASGASPQRRVAFDHDSPEVSDDEETAESVPLLDERVKQELDKRVKRELEKRVVQELEERVKQEVDKRATQEIERRVQELDERVKREVRERVRLEHGDSGAPLKLKVQWKSLIESLPARGGNKDYNFSKLKVELEF